MSAPAMPSLALAMGPAVQAHLDAASVPAERRVRVGNRTVTVPSPFPSPADWRDQPIYFLMVDRFNNPQAPPRVEPWDGACGVFQGGTFNGIRAQLDYLAELGVGALWLSPVLKNCQYSPFTYHGYGIQDFLQVDPRFASDPEAARLDPSLAEEELRALVDEAHARGLYVIFDIVLNHAGDVFEYVLDDGSGASEAGWRDVAYPIRWRDTGGSGRADWSTAPADPAPDAAIWPAEIRRNDFFRRKGQGGELGGDFASLKEFVTGFRQDDPRSGLRYPVRTALIRAYQYAIARFDVDGFRIDTLKYIEPEFATVFGNAMREFSQGIGKANFFTFGEVYDNEEKIARFIGRNASEVGDLIGVDAALDFPLFYVLPGAAKGRTPPAAVVDVFEHRKQVQRDILSSHGEASRFFVTFLDNHDQAERFYYVPDDDPDHYRDQLTLAATCLFSLQGIPCLYYGTEQGLHGRGSDLAVREALWGKPGAFERTGPIYRAIAGIAAVRRAEPALRYGRQYFRPLSGDGQHFGISDTGPGVLAFSRILNETEVVIAANTATTTAWAGEVIVDLALNPAGVTYQVLYSNKVAGEGANVPDPVVEKDAGQVSIAEVSGAVTNGPARALPVRLGPMEVQILGRS
jgi:glycosidase